MAKYEVVETGPDSLVVDSDVGADEPSILFSPEVQERWASWLDRFERFMYPVFEARGYSRDAALAAFLLNLQYSVLRDVRHNTFVTADVLVDVEDDDWGPGAGAR